MKSEQAVLPNPCLEEDNQRICPLQVSILTHFLSTMFQCHMKGKKNVPMSKQLVIKGGNWTGDKAPRITRGCIQKFPD
jgi:hypothetical protein